MKKHIIQIVQVPFMVNCVGYDFEKREVYRWPMLGMALVEEVDSDEEQYNYINFFNSDSLGDIDLDEYQEDRLGFEFNGKELDWTLQIKKLVERKEKKDKKMNTN